MTQRVERSAVVGSNCADAALGDDPPIACSLAAGDLADRVQRWRRALDGSTPHQRADGAVRVALGVDRLPELAALIVDETRCCPFFTFTLTVSHAGVQLDVAAPDDARPCSTSCSSARVSCCRHRGACRSAPVPRGAVTRSRRRPPP